MDWFYAIDDQKYGPSDATQMAELSRKGIILADDLVWNEKLENWEPLRKVASEIFGQAQSGANLLENESDETPSGVETAVCAHSNRVLPKSELIPYGDRWIDPEHKEAFLQGLMETGSEVAHPVPASEGENQMIPVGFWWRVLASYIDQFVVWLPSMLCMVPFFVVSFGAEMNSSGEPLAGWTAAMGITYALGLFGMFVVMALYHGWMVVKWRATVGKMAIGAVIVQPDGSPLRFGRAIGRWFCFAILNYVIIMIGAGIGAGIGVAIMGGMSAVGGEDNTGAMAGGFVVMMLLMFLGMLLGSFPYWMAAFDPEKRALHDRICATRVVKKF